MITIDTGEGVAFGDGQTGITCTAGKIQPRCGLVDHCATFFATHATRSTAARRFVAAAQIGQRREEFSAAL
jgi:hypothetical protein